ncbi:MAG: DUF4198 domain-containing protein, partial [Deltaproteobacteria bacterium]|nr:DUF4198 domain-containing protein [Deltaproteobacteria bacterium]
MKRICLAFIFALSCSSTALAHSLWINAFESRAHGSHHAMVSL